MALIGKSGGKRRRRTSICARPVLLFPRPYISSANWAAVGSGHGCSGTDARAPRGCSTREQLCCCCSTQRAQPPDPPSFCTAPRTAPWWRRAQRHKSMVRTPNSTLSKQVTVSTHSVIEYRVRCSTKTHETCHMTRKLYELFEPEKRPYSQLGGGFKL